jgi:iron complex outermembrane receptor protein
MKPFTRSFRGAVCPTLILLMMVLSNNLASAQNIRPADTANLQFDTLYRQLDEVVISATRVSKRIIDIPYSVSRINFVNYKYDRKIGANDMLSSVPGLFLQSRYGTHDVRFSIRGFGSRSNSGVRGIRILLDDIPESEPDGQTRLEALDFDAIGRIEVVKGNASSLYTNAPGGVASFFNDIGFTRSSITSLNQFGSFGLRKNGFKAAIRTPQYGFLGTYSYINYDGYRVHNNEYWNIINLVLETTPSDHTSLKILGYYVDGEIKLPGSLTKAEFDADPWQASQRSVDRDEKRITTKGRLGIRYNALFGGNLNNEIEVTSFVALKYFERTAKDYRIISRYVFGISARYVNTSRFWGHLNEFSVGGDLFLQPARIEYYDNIGGTKGDQLEQLENEKISNKGFYISENFEIIRQKLYVLLTGRFDNVVYDIKQETLPSLSDRKPYSAFTPKLALNYKITPQIALFGSYGLSFDSPANNEMESPDPAYLYNTDLKPQESGNAELGIKGNVFRWNSEAFRKLLFEATLFYINVKNEIVPYEVLGSVYYRNAAKTSRTGCELGAQLEILRDLNFTATYTYSYFKYDTYMAMAVEEDSTGTLITTEEDYAGNIAPSVPRNNIYLALAYSRTLNRHITGFVKLSYNGISGMWVDDANSAKTNAYNLVNSTLGFDMKFGHFNFLVTGGVNNIFDEIYVGFTNTNSADKRYYEAGAPRDWFLSVNLGYTF